MLIEFTRNINSINKTSIYSPFSSVRRTTASVESHVHGVIQKHMLAGNKGLFRGDKPGAGQCPYWIAWFASSNIWSRGCPVEEWGKGEQEHHNLKGN